MSNQGQIYDDILNYINGISIFDTHEHLEPLSLRLNKNVDLFNVLFSQYIDTTIISSGMSLSDHDIIIDEKTDVETKWKLLSPYLENVRNTTYYKAIERVLTDILDVSSLDDNSYKVANQKIKDINKPGLYEKIIQEKCKIKYCTWDNLFTEHCYTAEFIKPVFRIDDFIMIQGIESINSLEAKYNSQADTLGSLLQLFGKVVGDAKKSGYIALKNAVAYSRILLFEEVNKEEAERAFSRLRMHDCMAYNDLKIIQDYIVHESVKLSIDLDLKVQIHTGAHAGNGNYITNSNPVHLTNILFKYPQAQFALFHGGYPYGGELAVMAQYFPNVFMDMSWMHVISPSYCVRYLNQWLDSVPENKIFGFGGDFISVEMVYGHLQIAKENITKALTHRVEDRLIDFNQARNVARKLLYDNPATFYGLN